MSEALLTQSRMRNQRYTARPQGRNMGDGGYNNHYDRSVPHLMGVNSQISSSGHNSFIPHRGSGRHTYNDSQYYRPRGIKSNGDFHSHEVDNPHKLQSFLMRRWRTFESQLQRSPSFENKAKPSNMQWERGQVITRTRGSTSNNSSPLDSPLAAPSQNSKDEEASSVSSTSSSLRRHQPKPDTHKSTPEKHWTHQEVQNITLHSDHKKTDQDVVNNCNKRHQSASSTSMITLSSVGSQEKDVEFFTPDAPSPNNVQENGKNRTRISSYDKQNLDRNRIGQLSEKDAGSTEFHSPAETSPLQEKID